MPTVAVYRPKPDPADFLYSLSNASACPAFKWSVGWSSFVSLGVEISQTLYRTNSATKARTVIIKTRTRARKLKCRQVRVLHQQHGMGVYIPRKGHTFLISIRPMHYICRFFQVCVRWQFADARCAPACSSRDTVFPGPKSTPGLSLSSQNPGDPWRFVTQQIFQFPRSPESSVGGSAAAGQLLPSWLEHSVPPSGDRCHSKAPLRSILTMR